MKVSTNIIYLCEKDRDCQIYFLNPTNQPLLQIHIISDSKIPTLDRYLPVPSINPFFSTSKLEATR